MSSIMNLNRGEGGWNYSDPSKPDYMPSITGTVVEINEVQQRDYQTNEPKFFDAQKTQPRLNIELVIQGQSGKEITWQFTPRNGNPGYDAVRGAIKAADPNATSIIDIGGKMIQLTTQGKTDDFGPNKPRPWTVQIIGQGTVPFRGHNEFVPQAQPVMQQPMAQPMMAQPMMAQPMMQQPMAQPAMDVQAMQNMAMYGQPVPPSPLNRTLDGQAVQQQAQPMQQQPVVDPTPSVYDQDIPF